MPTSPARPGARGRDDAAPDFEPIQIARIELAEPMAPLVRGTSAAGAPYRRARVLVLLHDVPVGVVWLDLDTAVVPAPALAALVSGDLRAAVENHLRAGGPDRPAPLADPGALLAGLPGPCACAAVAAPASPDAIPLASVVLATRGRPATLPHALDALLDGDHPHFEVVVVDNSPEDPRTAALIAERHGDDPRVRLVAEPRPGLSRARNRGLREARGDLVAFTDDDVTVHPAWLRRLAAEFDDPGVVCVTGLVEPARLESVAQWWFECAAGFGRGVDRVAYSLAQAPAASPLFPYQLGVYGTGASMALRRSGLPPGWLFDEALGAGSRTQGGEDIDLFLDVLTTGGTLVYQPTALSFHTHRADDVALTRQMRGYGRGLTALLTKRLLHRPGERRLLLGRVAAGVRHAVGPEFRRSRSEDVAAAAYPPALRLAELRGMLAGPFAYVAGPRPARAAR